MGKGKRRKEKANESRSRLKVAVAMLTDDRVFADTSFSVLEMFSFSMMQGIEMTWVNPKVSRIETGRNMSVSQTKEMNADYVLFVDSDMICDREALVKLLNRNVDIVGCNAAKRTVPFLPVYTEDINGEFLNFQEGKIYEMDYVGMAFTLIKMSVFEKLEEPYYFAEFDESKMMPLGEDICFCRAARKKGFKIWCDMDVSMSIGHIHTQALYLPKDFTKEYMEERLSEVERVKASIIGS